MKDPVGPSIKDHVMAFSNINTVEIREKEVLSTSGRKKLIYKELYIDNCRRAALEQQNNGQVKFRFDPVGGFDTQEASVWILGLLELLMHLEDYKK